MKKVHSEYKNQVEIEVLSGGMILPEEPVHISATAGYISKAYKNVEELPGILNYWIEKLQTGNLRWNLQLT
jgi:putative protein-disulfide isomerase